MGSAKKGDKGVRPFRSRSRFQITFNHLPKGLIIMLTWTITFLVVAVIAAVLGFGGLAGIAATIAKVCFVIFLALFVISLITGRRPAI